MRIRKDWLEWFRVDRDLPDHPKIHALAKAHGCSRHEAIGRLICFWAWVARYAPHGILTQADHETARELGHGVAEMEAAALLERANGDSFRVRNWHDFNGHAAKERERKRRGNSARIPREFRLISEPTVRNGTERNVVEPSSASSKPQKEKIVAREIEDKHIEACVARFGLPRDQVVNIAEQIRAEAKRRKYVDLPRALANWCGNSKPWPGGVPREGKLSPAQIRQFFEQQEAK